MGVPQGSILGLLFFNRYMCDLFLYDCESNIINYADDTTRYVCEPNMDLVSSKLEKKRKKAKKSHPLATSDNVHQFSNSKYEEVLGALIDHELTFENHLLNTVLKVNQKIHVFERISKYMPRKKLRTTMEVFVSS